MSELVVKTKTAAYLLINKEIAELKDRQQKIKDELEPYLAEAEQNSRGSYVIPFGESLEIHGQLYKGLQKVRKESRVLNEERVLQYLKDKAVYESPDGRPFADSRWYAPVLKVEHVDQDALWDLYARDLITQEEFDSFFDSTVSYSFLPTKE
jgi:hypothetical protein